MISKLEFNPVTAKLDLVKSIPQLDSDPSSPNSEDLWVLKSVTGGGAGVGEAYGLLLTLTQPGAGAATSYELSFRTLEGTTVRTALS